ncbi:FliM/FliN family flagellar motor switch protein [Paracoccus aestuariivivens]
MVYMDDIKVDVSVRLGRCLVEIGNISCLSLGSVLQLDCEMSDVVDICVGEKVIATGELIRIEGCDKINVKVIGVIG